jgi:hypothetical protein
MEQDSRTAPVVGARYVVDSGFARRCLCMRLGAYCAELDRLIDGLSSTLARTEGEPDPLLDDINAYLELGRKRLADAAALAIRRLDP